MNRNRTIMKKTPVYLLCGMLAAVSIFVAGCGNSGDDVSEGFTGGWEKIDMTAQPGVPADGPAPAGQGWRPNTGAEIEQKIENMETDMAGWDETQDADAAGNRRTDGDESPYTSVTALPKKEVEIFAKQVRKAYLDENWEKLSGMIDYPITLNPGGEVGSAEEFLARMDGKKVSDGDAAEMKAESCTNMFVNGQGICMGSGQIWLRDTGFNGIEETGDPQMKIIAISGIIE